MTLSREDVRDIVKSENAPMQEGITALVGATNKMTEAITDLAAQSMVIDEKLMHMNSEIERCEKMATDANTGLLRLSTDIIPDIEQQVALNGFSASSFWKLTGMFVAPVGAIGTYLYSEINARNDHIEALVTSLTELISKL